MSVFNRFQKVKFRCIKKIKQFMVSKARIASYLIRSIRYELYNILSKYNIIYNKHNYLDYIPNSGSELLSEDIEVETEHFKIKLGCTCLDILYINEDYFFRKTKNGKKICFVVNDIHNNISEFHYYPKEIMIRFQEDSKWLLINDQPLKVATCFDSLNAKEYILDTTPLWELHFKLQFPIKFEEILEDDISVANLKAKREIEAILKDIKLGRLIKYQN